MMRKIFYSIILTVVSICSFGQTNSELIKLGDAAMINGQYTNAVYYYAFILYKVKQGEEAAYYPYEITTTYKEPKKDENGTIVPPTNPSKKEIVLIHKLAEAYLSADDYQNAKIWHEAAVKYPNPEHPNARYHYGVSLMYNELFEEAMVQFEQFQTEIGDPENKFYKKAASNIASCQFALNPENTDEDIMFTPLDGAMNVGTTNFGIQFTADDHIIFSSARSSTKESDTAYNPMDKYLLDIYIAPVNADGSIGEPEKFPFTVNSSEFHEGSAVVSADGQTIFFTKMDPSNRNETKIYGSRKVNNSWLEPYLLDPHVNLDGFRSMTPFLSANGEKLYYASNRPGGEGGLDLWSVKMTSSGQTGRAVNLGDKVNTGGDEFTPFFHDKSQILYYSSDGHIGFGGQDVFFNEWNADAEAYGQTTNAGAPINSSADDSYFVIDEKLENGFVTSNRESCSECDSIYSLKVHCNRVYQVKRPEIQFAINGYVYDKETNEIIPNAKVEFKDVSYEWEHFEVFTDENGYYEHALVPDLELFMRASQTDFFADKALISTIGETESKTFKQNFYLEKIPKGEITIEGIEYDFDSANLRPESELILDNLIEFLELNDNLVIEIRSHTDQRGGDDYNLKLSQRRAQSVVDYLIEHDIPMERLVPKGYGETKPAEITDDEGNTEAMTIAYIANIKSKDKRKEAHQRNRRTAFFVLEQK
ncbi:MAG: OOP family OmpA-OmpF porin [Crocinitomix sp.]|jgi:OOP family OmpA-OmpF porin